jgi:hypothetical protein
VRVGPDENANKDLYFPEYAPTSDAVPTGGDPLLGALPGLLFLVKIALATL